MRATYDDDLLRPLLARIIRNYTETAARWGLGCVSTLTRQVSPDMDPGGQRALSVKVLFNACAEALARATTDDAQRAALAPLRALVAPLGYTLAPLPAAEPAGAPLESLAEIDVGKGALSRAVLEAIEDEKITDRELARIRAAIQDVQARLVGLDHDATAFCAGEQRGVA